MNRDDLGAWARQKIDEALRAAPATVAEGGKAFMVWGTIGSCGYVDVEGDVYLEEDTFDPQPGTFRKRGDEHARRQVLVVATRRYPELASCLPSRGAEDPDCFVCTGTGWRLLGEHKILCDVCDGLGWVVRGFDDGAA